MQHRHSWFWAFRRALGWQCGITTALLLATRYRLHGDTGHYAAANGRAYRLRRR